MNACVAHLLVLFQTIYGDKDARFKKWFQSKAREIHQKMTFDDIMDSKIEVEANVMGNSSISPSEMDGDDTMEVSAPVDKDDADDGDLL